MLKEIVLSAVLLSGCTMFSSQNELFDKVIEPAKLEDIELIIHEENFFTAGWICAEKAGYPVILHPVFLTLFGCADVHWKDGKVYKCEVWYCCGDWVLEHELEHCKGYKD